MLSQTAEYALRAVLFLAERGADGPVAVDEIAGALGMPSSYLSKTLQTLVKAGVLTSERGRTGGFQLAVSPGKLRLIRVIAPFEQDAERRHCLLGRAECSDRAACVAHAAWKVTADHIARFFRTTTVASIQGPIERLRTPWEPSAASS